MSNPFKYTHAIVCRVPDSFETGAIGAKGVNMSLAKQQHAEYVTTLRRLGLDVIELPPDEGLPDCVFVEDTAVVVNGTAFITRPGAPSRQKEAVIMKSIIQKEVGLPIVEISDKNATIDGGDVLFTGKEFFVGISDRTNLAGARALAAAFPEFPCTPVKVSGALHLKSLVTMAGPDVILASKSKECEEVLKRMEREATFQYQILRVPDSEAANCLYINGTLIHRSKEEYPESVKVFSELGCETLELNGSEIAKAQESSIRTKLEKVSQHINKDGDYITFRIAGINICGFIAGARTADVAFALKGACFQQSDCMSNERRKELQQETREMFYHAYRAYMDHAYPADELMPLSCKGRWRGSEHSRGDIDDALGNFSLTLVDSLDTLFILGDFDEFERGAQLIIKDVHFDHDIIVSVFETNIRMMGGLLSGHVLSGYLQEHYSRMLWYKGELLNMALDLGYRLLPAFNTSTGIPHSKVNLKYGLRTSKLSNSKETCTACAGTMILEFAALSRLSGDPIFEEKAHKAMDALWSLRHRSSDLMGTVLNIHNGDWTRRDSGVGAGIDSYYEYCLKAYILLGDERYLDRFNRHYSAVMKYISQGPLLLDVHMHRPHTNSRNFMDALLAFWPGLQVLKGDLKPAVETHEMLYQVMQRHNFLPEAFTTDFQVHWGQHPLRPEFVESTYFLYRATGDPYYLEAGAKVVSSLQRYARVPCGFAAVKDVRTGQHEDQMDSFVLSETFKYLYLLFSTPEDLPVQVDDFVFTTEAHLLPLSLARLSNLTSVPLRSLEQEEERNSVADFDVEHARSCPSNHYLFPGHHGFAESIRWSESIRLPLKNMVDKVCPTRRSIKRKLKAIDFQAGNSEHMKLLRDMGITVVGLPDGRVQLLHSYSQARTTEDAEEGLLFMQEMVELSRTASSQPDNPPRSVSFKVQQSGGSVRDVVLKAGPAQFGLELKDDVKVMAPVVIGKPFRMCRDPINDAEMWQKIAIIQRGDCMFVEKARRLQKAGAVGGIVIDNSPSSSADAAPLFAMSGDGTEDVKIPMVFLYSSDADVLMKAMQEDPNIQVTLAESPNDHDSILSPQEVRVDEDAAVVPTMPDLSSDGMIEKLRSEVKRIVVERMKEEAETQKRTAEGQERSKGTFIIRLDEKGGIVTEAVDGDVNNVRLESYSIDAEDAEKSEKIEEEKKIRRAFITLLRMTLHLLLSLQDESKTDSGLPGTDVDLSDLSDDIRNAIVKVFQHNNADIRQGIAQRSIDDVLSSFRILWPENILPRRHFSQLEQILVRLARDPVADAELPSDGDRWEKEKGEKLVQFMRSIRGEFATHLRQFNSKLSENSGLNSAHEPKPNRTPDEL